MHSTRLSNPPGAVGCTGTPFCSAHRGGRTAPRRARGITLIELLVVVAIAVALSAIIIPTYQNYMDDVRLATVRGDFAQISIHLERFRTEAP